MIAVSYSSPVNSVLPNYSDGENIAFRQNWVDQIAEKSYS